MTVEFPYQVIDLTHTLSQKAPSWSRGCGFQHEVKFDYDGCPSEVKFRVQQIKMHAGIGTHIDAPSHCVPGGKSVEDIALKQLMVPALVMDISAKMAENSQLLAQDVFDFEAAYGRVPVGCFVVVYTGWSQFWDTAEKYHNDHLFPSISKEAAELLLARGVVGLGIDTLSPDVPSSGFPVHQAVLGAGRYIVENIANAHQLPPVGAWTLIEEMLSRKERQIRESCFDAPQMCP